MPLTATAIRKAKPREKPRKLYDSRGLYLEIAPRGTKAWRFKYRFAGKEKRISMGIYPDVSLKLARRRRDEARQASGPGHRPERLPQGAEAVEAPVGQEQASRRWPPNGWPSTRPTGPRVGFGALSTSLGGRSSPTSARVRSPNSRRRTCWPWSAASRHAAT